MTEHQQAIADALAEVSAGQAGVWTFGEDSFAGAESDLRPSDPRMIGAPDKLIEVRVSTSLLPYVLPKRGQEMTRGGESHTIHKVDHSRGAGVTIFLVHRSSAIVR